MSESERSTNITAPQEPGERAPRERIDSRRWRIRLFVQPLLFLGCGVLLILALGVAQRTGWIAAGGSSGQPAGSASNAAVSYICPMMCTPPQTEPGRCPVCAMELVPTTSGGGQSDGRSIQIDPASRRVANIQTVAVASAPMSRAIRAIGELSFDEGTLRTIAAYVDGRLERLYADYTGVDVKQGDNLALVYSPRLYSSQVELLLARKTRNEQRGTTVAGLAQSSSELYASAKQRLIELGMTPPQLEQLELEGEANSRLHLIAPSSGTVIEKLAVEGDYVREGEPIYRLADLSNVWLMLRLFPEDAASIRYGQKVEAEVQSLRGRTFVGRVAFVDPNVDSKTRTVGVRVVISNTDGLLRVGDYAKATIEVPLADSPRTLVYDPELANKWISPRHPHVITDSPGDCPVCGVELVPASQFGFTDQPSPGDAALVVPRNAVLMAGQHSVVYVETEPGRFEIRRVVLGPSSGDQVVVLSGVEEGDQVATNGNFLIDSQMQLAGNPSLIDPTRAEPPENAAPSAEIMAALSALSPADRELAEKQGICPVADSPLGSMGTPPKVDVNGTPVFICCEGCRASLLADPGKYLAKLAARTGVKPERELESSAAPQWELPPITTPQLIEWDDTDAESPHGAGDAGGSGPGARRGREEAPR
ncbi:MAG: HlyD family efflux transporter periplasmic adaptor subunit [Planctomycetes bacterium]|nr:HlyD family efflux transporter periplasmic adaptor subunit [Planctomycetota bacterium]